MSQRPRITIVGAGICAPEHITREGDAALRDSDLIFFLLDLHPALRRYLRSLGPELVDLDPLYRERLPDREVYDDITRVVVFAAAVRSRTALLVPGHPGLYVTATREIVERAEAMGIETEVLPGISSLDTMILQLGLEIGERGVQIYEANRFVYQRIEPDTRVPLFLLQPGAVGSSLLTHRSASRPRRFHELRRALEEAYGGRHPCVVLASRSTRRERDRKHTFPIADLAKRSELLDHDVSLYVPPRGDLPIVDEKFHRRLADRSRLAEVLRAPATRRRR